jgi:hypothetical protein
MWRRRRDREFSAELQSHLDMRLAELYFSRTDPIGQTLTIVIDSAPHRGRHPGSRRDRRVLHPRTTRVACEPGHRASL